MEIKKFVGSGISLDKCGAALLHELEKSLKNTARPRRLLVEHLENGRGSGAGGRPDIFCHVKDGHIAVYLDYTKMKTVTK